MEERRERDPLVERRRDQVEEQDLWMSLTLAQKFSASSLAKYGYKLKFIRCSASGNTAIMQLNHHATAITCDGNINTSPDIKIR